MPLAVWRPRWRLSYPEDDTTTAVSGRVGAQAGSTRVNLSWQERGYALRGRRTIDLNGSYTATVTGDRMNADWRQGNQTIVQFTMTATDESKASTFPG